MLGTCAVSVESLLLASGSNRYSVASVHHGCIASQAHLQRRGGGRVVAVVGQQGVDLELAVTAKMFVRPAATDSSFTSTAARARCSSGTWLSRSGRCARIARPCLWASPAGWTSWPWTTCCVPLPGSAYPPQSAGSTTLTSPGLTPRRLTRPRWREWRRRP